MAKTNKTVGDDPKALEKKWGEKTIKVEGWTGFPNLLLERQQALKLDPIKLNILLVLMKHWWRGNDWAYPSKQTIADIIGRDRSTVQKHIREMEKQGLISRGKRHHSSGGQSTNLYDLSGLVTKLQKFADELAATKEKRKEEDGRKRRGRAVVESDLS